MIATKASRVVQAAKGKAVIEFGLRTRTRRRRRHESRPKQLHRRLPGTSNVLAGMAYGIPVFGTMAHSFVMSFEKEIDAFRAFAKTFPNKSTLLIDTYDDMAGAEKAAIVAKELEKKGCKLGGVRLDSGDLAETSKKVRALLDEKGLGYVNIFASGDLDEYKIAELLSKDAKIDAFGVGTKMGTSADYPYTDVIYKLCETMNAERRVFTHNEAEQRQSHPARKKTGLPIQRQRRQLRKRHHCAGRREGQWEPLLVKVMENGKILREPAITQRNKERSLRKPCKAPCKIQETDRMPQSTLWN